MRKLPPAARTAHEVLGLPHNILLGAELVDAGCILHLDKYMAEIELEGETLYKGFRDRPTRLWKICIDPNDGNRIMPLPDNDVLDTRGGLIMATMLYDVKAGLVLSAMHEGMNDSLTTLYQCGNLRELVQYLHACLFSHPKSTLNAAAKVGYLRGFPGLTVENISKYINVSYETEAGHMRATPHGTRSTTKTSTRGRPRITEDVNAAEKKQQ